MSQEPVDVVYCWVDGSDPKWQKLRNQALQKVKSKRFVSKGSSSSVRYQDHEELRYSLRSLHQHASFVNHIYIVTMNQRPAWLDDHPQITVVSHQDIFAYPEHLPTFNSLSIESHLHRIPGLSEKYLYLNDDYFFNKPVKSEDFFTKDGLIQEVFDPTKTYRKGSEKSLSGAQICLYNTQRFLDGLFGAKIRPYPTHTPHPFLKSYVETVENLYPEIFYKSSLEKFRGGKGFSITYSFLQHYGLETGRYIESPLKEHTLILKKSMIEQIDHKLDVLLHSEADFISIQDEFSPDEIMTEKVSAFLMKKYPEPAPWEKQDAVVHSAFTIGKCFQSVVE